MDTVESRNIIRSLYLSFFSTLAVILLVVALYIASQYSQKWIIHTNEVKSEVHNLSETLLGAQSDLRGYLMTQDPEYKINYKVAIAKLDAQLSGLRDKVKDNPSQLDNLNKYSDLIDERVAAMNNSLENYVLGTPEENFRRAGRNQLLKLIDSLDNMRDIMLVEENEILLERRSTYDTIYVLSLVSLAIALLLMLYNVYAVRQRLIPLFNKLARNNEDLTTVIHSRDNEISLKEAQMEVNEDLLLQMENKNKQLNQFAYIASHDLQEPLRTVDNFIELFEEEYAEQLDAGAKQYFDFIKGATERMKSLITGLLNYSRLGKSGRRVKVDLSKTIDNIKNDLSTRIEDTGAIITHDSLPTVTGYQIELRQLFANLIGNAIKFMPKDRVPKIHVSVSESNLYYTFKISDNGLGIKEEHLDKIFNMFTRLHSAKEYEGTGIGLAFCQKIIELHKGKISVDSVIDQGSTFTFTLKK